MNLSSLFCAVTTGRFLSPDGSFLWVCPLCDGHVETEANSHDRDRRALLHCVYHRGPLFSEIEHVAASPTSALMDTTDAGLDSRGAMS